MLPTSTSKHEHETEAMIEALEEVTRCFIYSRTNNYTLVIFTRQIQLERHYPRTAASTSMVSLLQEGLGLGVT